MLRIHLLLNSGFDQATGNESVPRDPKREKWGKKKDQEQVCREPVTYAL